MWALKANAAEYRTVHRTWPRIDWTSIQNRQSPHLGREMSIPNPSRRGGGPLKIDAKSSLITPWTWACWSILLRPGENRHLLKKRNTCVFIKNKRVRLRVMGGGPMANAALYWGTPHNSVEDRLDLYSKSAESASRSGDAHPLPIPEGSHGNIFFLYKSPYVLRRHL
jgi:hypothetical protein